MAVSHHCVGGFRVDRAHLDGAAVRRPFLLVPGQVTDQVSWARVIWSQPNARHCAANARELDRKAHVNLSQMARMQMWPQLARG